MAKFNFRTVTDSFNKLVYQYPIRIPERFSLVIRSLLTQEGICLSLSPDFRFLEVAYPYVAKRLLTDTDTGLRDRLLQVLFFGGSFQWRRLENLLELATQTGEGLDMTDTVVDGAKVLALDDALRNKLLVAVTQDNRLHVDEVRAATCCDTLCGGFSRASIRSGIRSGTVHDDSPPSPPPPTGCADAHHAAARRGAPA
jgi:predicted unusual protein kinase regulating ubiquinone biosynthesis (AarF/ABC1/UbiB family)